jgi:hypothetical protein
LKIKTVEPEEDDDPFKDFDDEPPPVDEPPKLVASGKKNKNSLFNQLRTDNFPE